MEETFVWEIWNTTIQNLLSKGIGKESLSQKSNLEKSIFFLFYNKKGN